MARWVGAMERFARVVKGYQLLTTFENHSILDVRQGSKYACADYTETGGVKRKYTCIPSLFAFTEIRQFTRKQKLNLCMEISP